MGNILLEIYSQTVYFDSSTLSESQKKNTANNI